MLKELSWYIESNRFTDIVQEIESLAENYCQALETGNERTEEIREEFRTLCQWHIEKSGYKVEGTSFIDVDTEFFNGETINREALNTFEKEIIKAHLYQKHLWEFMGTTGNMTIISKLGMKKDGLLYENYLPLEYKKKCKAKSPIWNILRENPNAVPIYVYPDGSISGEYDPSKSKIRFDTLKDKSGFDWSRKGWDPNYEVEKVGWYGDYDENDYWVMVRESEEPKEQERLPGAKIQSVPILEIIQDRDVTILYDPGYSLLSVFEKIYLLVDGEIYGAEVADIEETVRLIDIAMTEMGVKKIDVIAGDKKSGPKEEYIIEGNAEYTANETQNEKRIELYRKLLGERISEDVEIKTTKEVQEIKEKIIRRMQEEGIADKESELQEKIEAAYKRGIRGEEIIRAVRTNRIKVPLSIYNRQDCLNAGLGEDMYKVLQRYSVPEDRRELFSNAILNLLLEEETLSTSGKTLEELFERVYENVVQEKEIDEVISVETTFEQLCRNPWKRITTEGVEEGTLQALEKVKRELPAQATIEKQRLVEEAVDNVIRNFSAIRMSTGMTPEEAVRLAAKTVGGKSGEAFVPPTSGIVYGKFGKDGLQGSGKEKRIFGDIALKDVVEKAKSRPVQMKEVEFQIDRTRSEEREAKGSGIKGIPINLKSKKEIRRLLKSTAGKRQKPIDEKIIDEYMTFTEGEHLAQKVLLVNPEIFERYMQSHPISTRQEVEALLQASSVVQEAKGILFCKAEREAWYKSEGFAKYGVEAEEFERVIAEEQARAEREAAAASVIKEYSKTLELDRKHGLDKGDFFPKEGCPHKIARIETATKAKSVAKVIEELKAKESEGQHMDLAAGTKSRQQTYVPAQIRADGRIGRQILGAVSGKDFAAEKNALMNGSYALDKGDAIEVASVLEKGMGQLGEQGHEGETSLVQGNSFFPEYASAGNQPGGQVPAQGKAQMAEYTLEGWGMRGAAAGRASGGGGGETGEIVEPLPEEVRRAQMNANYEHDKAALAKEDPLFAKNRFWDVGHAEGSGETERSSYNNMLNKAKEETCAKIEEKEWQV